MSIPRKLFHPAVRNPHGAPRNPHGAPRKPPTPVRSPQLTALFRALADPHRRWLIKVLCGGPTPMSELAGQLPLTLPAAMRHLRVLEQAGIVESEKIGRVRTCTLKLEALRIAEDWLAKQRAVVRRLESIEQLNNQRIAISLDEDIG